MFQRTQRRVKAHIAICFVAFSLLRIPCYWHNSMHGGKQPPSEVRILSELSRVEVSVIRYRNTGNLFAMPSEANHAQISLYNTVGHVMQRQNLERSHKNGFQPSWLRPVLRRAHVTFTSSQGYIAENQYFTRSKPPNPRSLPRLHSVML